MVLSPIESGADKTFRITVTTDHFAGLAAYKTFQAFPSWDSVICGHGSLHGSNFIGRKKGYAEVIETKVALELVRPVSFSTAIYSWVFIASRPELASVQAA